MNEFEHSARQTLRNSEQLLDRETTAELAQRRELALAATSKWQLPSFFAPAASMAAASLVALVLIYPFGATDNTLPQDDYLTENVELYEDLDFYSWLASNEPSMEG